MGKKRSHTSTCNIVYSQNECAWTADEHQRFLLALEQFGGGQCSSIHEAWQYIATAVGTRETVHVLRHAQLYFAQLQQQNEQQFTHRVESSWTPEEDATFEYMLAADSISSECYPWEVMISRLPGKSPEDLKERYQKLCYDVAQIEKGQHMAREEQISCPRLLDSGITLTFTEEQILASAMAQVFVPPEASADVLAGIASAVAAFTTSNGRAPPERTQPLFTKEQALEVLNNLLKAQQRDPLIVLETLVAKLRLHSSTLDVSTGLTFGEMLQ